MSDQISLSLEEAQSLGQKVLRTNGFNDAHARSIMDVIYRCQLDDCHSHGLYRLLVCANTIRAGLVKGDADVEVSEPSPAAIRVDAKNGYSLLAFETGLPYLIEKTRKNGIGLMAINNCFHFSALWPEVEKLSEAGLAAMAMLPSHAWVAPAGGTKGSLGTNPLAFSWPRGEKSPYTFDFATSAIARGEIELAKRAGHPLPEGAAIDEHGEPTIDPNEALKGAMLTFGGYKGSALSTMIELMAGPMIGDLTSLASLEKDGGKGGTPLHGEVIIAFDPKLLGGTDTDTNSRLAETLFTSISEQGARLPSQRRYAARARNLEAGTVTIPKQLHEDILALL
jgi:LDH2 family malate/lactate/ureidoglycolate dehydrogenase